MTLATLTNRLLSEGTIARVRVNRYEIRPTGRSQQLGAPVGHIVTLSQVHAIFTEVIPGVPGEYRFRRPFTAPQEPVRPAPPEPPRLRTIRRDSYHGNHGHGIHRDGVDSALMAIERDADGVRRSFGLEWEVGALTPAQEDKLARLLDTLPAHHTERDGSLTNSGVEIIFLPMSAEKLVQTWNTLKEFTVRENIDQMDRTGAHITYGVSNSVVTNSDLQIRLNRIALAVKAAATQNAIKGVFGRDFTGYAQLPNSTTFSSHSNAWSASRGTSAYELRLCCWKGNVEKIIAFMKATEFVFTRTFTGNDFINIFNIMGCNCQGM